MVVSFDVGWDFALLDEKEDDCAIICHEYHAGLHVTKHAGGVSQQIIIHVTRGVQVCRDFAAEEDVAELSTKKYEGSSTVADDDFGLFGGG